MFLLQRRLQATTRRKICVSSLVFYENASVQSHLQEETWALTVWSTTPVANLQRGRSRINVTSLLLGEALCQGPVRITATAVTDVDTPVNSRLGRKKKYPLTLLLLFYYPPASSQSIPKLKACRTAKNSADFKVLLFLGIAMK